MSTATDTATGQPRPGRAPRPAGRAWPPPPLPPRSASAAPSPPDPRPPLFIPPHPPQNPPAVEPAAARSDIRATAMHSLSVTNPGRPAPAPLQQPITSNYMALPADPLFPLTFTQASHTSCLEMPNGLAEAFSPLIPLLPEH